MNYLDIFQSLKLHILLEKILSISLKLNVSPNTLGGYGLNGHIFSGFSVYILVLGSPLLLIETNF